MKDLQDARALLEDCVDGDDLGVMLEPYHASALLEKLEGCNTPEPLTFEEQLLISIAPLALENALDNLGEFSGMEEQHEELKKQLLLILSTTVDCHNNVLDALGT
jgi:hypothetical protein